MELAASSRGTDRTRRHNISVVLTQVHQSGGLSRSELTRRTGLNRSTIAALVGELVDRGLVLELTPDSGNQVGRPSPIVVPTRRALAVAVNPEIDAVTVAIVSLGGTVLDRVRIPTEGIPSVGEAVAISARAIAALAAEHAADSTVVGVGAAIPGLVRSADGLVRLAPHLGWVDEPFAELLEARVGLPVFASNDASAGVVAESIFGAARGVTDLVYLNGGASGIGGGVIAAARPLRGADGYAGEFGHTLVRTDGAACHCGASGCLETEVRRERLLALAGLDDADADDLELALVGSTSPGVAHEVERQLDYLAVALRNAINILNPRLVILGGFLGSLYAVAPEHLDALVARQPLAAAREGVSITRAALGSSILMIGAAELAFAGLLADPTAF